MDVHDADPNAATLTADAPPSVTSIDRSNWPRITLLVPQDAVVTAPSYAPLRRWTVSTVRERGESPGSIDALDLDYEGYEITESIFMPLATIYYLIAIIPRAFITPPLTPTMNPRVSYERSTPRWTDASPVTGTAASDEASREADQLLRERFGDSLLLNAPQAGAPRGRS